MTDYIKLGFGILLLVFVFFGFLWGIIRGLKKTVSRGLFLLLISILLIFIAVPVTNLILKIKITCEISLAETEIIGKYNIAELLTEFIKAYIGPDFVAKYPNFAQVIVSFGIIFVNSIVYLVLFWLLKYLLLPFNTLLTKLIFPKRRPKKTAEAMGFAADAESGEPRSIEGDKQVVANAETSGAETIIQTDKKAGRSRKEKKPKVKEKKRRMLGGLVGIVVGLVVTFNTMLPLYGIFDILDTAKELKLENLTEEPTDLNTLTDGMLDEISEAYKSSIMGTVSKYTGLQAAGLAGFDQVTTADIDGQKITLRGEIEAVINTINQADAFLGKLNTYTKDNFKSTTKEQLAELFSEARTLLGKCEQIKIVDCLADYMLPIACSFMVKSGVKVTNSPVVDEMIKDTLVTLINASGIDLFEEIYRLLDIAEYTNNQGLLIKVVKNDTENMLDLLDGLEADFGKNLMNKIFALQTVDTTLTQVFNIGLTFFEESTKFGYTESDITKNTLQEKLTELVDNTFKLALTMDSESPVMVTFDSIKPLGKLLHTVKTSGLINAETYTNLVTFATKKLKTITNSIVPEDLVDVVNNQIVENINSVEHWETEMYAISYAVDQLRAVDGGIIGEVKEGEALRVGNSINFEMSEATINNLGKAFDILEKTVIFGTELEQQVFENGDYYKGTTITKLLASACDMAMDNISGDGESELSGFTDVIKSIRTNIISAGHTYSSTNAKFYENEFKQISPLVVELGNILSGGEVELNTELGVKLDKAKSSIMFGNKTTLLLIKESMSMVSSEILGDGFSYNPDPTVQTTNDKIYELFEDIEDELDTIAVLNQSKQDSNFWQHEMESYLALKNIAENSGSISSTDDILPYGEDLDTAYSCYTIPKQSLNRVISFTVKQLKTNVTDGIEGKINELIDDIAANIEAETFTSPFRTYDRYWQIELQHIHNLNNISFDKVEDNPATTTIDETYNYEDMGFELDKVTLGYTTVGTDTTLGFDGTNANSIRASYLVSHNMIRELLGTAIADMKENIVTGFAEGTIRTAVSTALNSIQANASNTTNIPTISFTRELAHLDTLADLNIPENLFDDKPALISIGTTLDSIAFNKTVTTGTEVTITYSDNNSLLISRPIINTMIKDILPIAKSGEATPTTIDNTIDTVGENISTLTNNNSVMSWKQEFSMLAELLTLENAEINDTTYQSLGTTIDSIAFKKVGTTFNYNNTVFGADGSIKTTDEALVETANSLLVTRKMLNTVIASIVDDMADKETNETIKATLEDIADSIETNSSRIYSWSKEIAKVNELKKLNETTVSSSDVELPAGTTVDAAGNIKNSDNTDYNLENNPLIILGKNIDAISFNNDTEKFLDTTFDGDNIVTTEGTNSVIITRKILKDMVASFLKTAKPTGEPSTEDDIVIDIINNTTGKINTTATLDDGKTYFNTFVESFTALLVANTQIKNTTDEFDGVNITDITAEKAGNLDTLLENLQGNLICGIKTTKKVASVIVTKINTTMSTLYAAAGQSFTNTETGKYIAYLQSSVFVITDGTTVLDYKTDATEYSMKDGGGNYITTDAFATIKATYNPLV